MTTTVKIEAHCSSDKEVVYEIENRDGHIMSGSLNDGQITEVYAYDDRRITVYEQQKSGNTENPGPQAA